MPFRYSIVLQLTTQPADATVATSHIGGWSEAHWRNDNIDPQIGSFKRLMTKRASLLPTNAAIVGYRVASFTIRGNKLYPGPTSAGRTFLPGIYVGGDIPQMALSLAATCNAANSSRFNIAALPDDFVKGGEYAPDDSFVRNLQTFNRELINGDWGFIGRDLTQPSIRVLGIAAGVVTTDGSSVLFPGVDWIRFHRVNDVNGNAITGAFAIKSSPGANQYLLAGFNANIVAEPNGSVRRDLIQQYTYTTVTPGRVKVRKIGRPLEQYRGRRSKRKVA